MARQVQRTAAKSGNDQGQAADVSANPQTVEKGKKLKEDMDRLLGDIDEALEEGERAGLASYQQRGGE